MPEENGDADLSSVKWKATGKQLVSGADKISRRNEDMKASTPSVSRRTQKKNQAGARKLARRVFSQTIEAALQKNSKMSLDASSRKK